MRLTEALLRHVLELRFEQLDARPRPVAEAQRLGVAAHLDPFDPCALVLG